MDTIKKHTIIINVEIFDYIQQLSTVTEKIRDVVKITGFDHDNPNFTRILTYLHVH